MARPGNPRRIRRLTIAHAAAIAIGMATMAESTELDAQTLVARMASAGRAAQRRMASLRSDAKAAALELAASAIREDADAILAANARDLDAGRKYGLSDALLDRLLLDPARLEAIAAGVEAVARLPDPVGEVIGSTERPNGLRLSRVRVPIGLIGIIYESRPNVTADAAALCVRAGNGAPNGRAQV